MGIELAAYCYSYAYGDFSLSMPDAVSSSVCDNTMNNDGKVILQLSGIWRLHP